MGLILNFHGIGPEKRSLDLGERSYWLSRDRFASILDMIAENRAACSMTFDDGNSSDFDIAAPMLKARGIPATFFVLPGRLGECGYLTHEEVVGLDTEPLFTIGSHGMQHRDWTACDGEELDFEIGMAQSLLSELCQRQIDQVAIPFGKYDRRVLNRLKSFGCKMIYSSDGVDMSKSANPIARFSIRSDMPMEAIEALITHGPSVVSATKTQIRRLVKTAPIALGALRKAGRAKT